MSAIATKDLTYHDWKAKLSLELKGKDLTSYDYVWDGVSISPFDERTGIPINRFPKNKIGWLIGARCDLKNESILHALQFGAEIISIESTEKIKNFPAIFNDVRLDWISLELDTNDKINIKNLYAYLKKQDYLNTSGAVITAFENQYDLYSEYSSLLPGYKFLSLDCLASDTAATIANKFSLLIKLIERLADADSIQRVLTNMVIRFTPGHDLVLTISMIRALRLVWMHILKSFNRDIDLPVTIHSYIKNDGIKSTENMILSTAASMACVTGGTDALYIEPPDPLKQHKAWQLKLQHIMKEESQLDKADNLIAGAYTIERLSTIIAERIWEKI